MVSGCDTLVHPEYDQQDHLGSAVDLEDCPAPQWSNLQSRPEPRSWWSSGSDDPASVINAERIKKRLDLLGELPNGWAGDGEGVAPSKSVRDAVTSFVVGLAVPYLFASPDGGVSCEWDGRNDAQASAFFGPDGSIELYRSRGMDDQESKFFEDALRAASEAPGLIRKYLADISR